MQLKPGSAVTLQMTTSRPPGRNRRPTCLRCGIATLDRRSDLSRRVRLRAADRNHGARDGAQLNGGIDRAAAAAAWQKIVVRYREGSTLKGYTVDFHPSRGHFSLWPSVDAHAKRPACMVPLARLKALFFVKTFDGNKWHVAAESPHAASAGREIEVTFFDKEVVRGTTLGYRPDGVGFFITPLDSGSNNQRVFVVNSAVHQVKFP